MATRAPGGDGGGGGGGRRRGGGACRSRARVPLLVATVAALLTIALAGPAHQKHDRDAARVMKVGASSNNNVNNNNNNNNDIQDGNNNYSVSFVPLFSLLANFLPKLLSRFAIKPPESRSLGTVNENKDFLQSKGIFCGPESIGRWKDITDCHQFFECRVNPDSPPGCQTVLSRNNGIQKMDSKHTIKDNKSTENNIVPVLMDHYQNSCITLITYKCPNGLVYNDSLKQCEAGGKENSC